MKKLIPHPLLSAGLFLLWLALGNSISAGWVTLGLILAIVLPLLTQRFWISPPQTVRFMPALLLLMIVLYDIVVASLQVSRLVLGPVSRIRPAFVSVPLDLRDPYVATLLGSMVSLTPGTVAVDVDQETWIMQVHALDVADEAALVQTIKTRYEARLREIFSC
jgi:multicomponent K+:H+ antiporter subunit E